MQSTNIGNGISTSQSNTSIYIIDHFRLEEISISYFRGFIIQRQNRHIQRRVQDLFWGGGRESRPKGAQNLAPLKMFLSPGRIRFCPRGRIDKRERRQKGKEGEIIIENRGREPN